MITPVAEIIDGEALLSVVVAALVAGVGLTLMFSIALASASRAAELRRGGRRVGAAALGAVAVAGVLACLALVGFGLQVMISK